MKSVFIGALLTLMAWPLAAQYNVSGTVSDKATGEPIPFANILIEETKAGLQAGAEGNYVFEGLPSGIYTLVASSLGYAEMRQEVTGAGQNVTVDFALAGSAVVDDLQIQQVAPLDSRTIGLESVQAIPAAAVVTTMATERTPIAFWNVTPKDIQRLNNGQDLPQLLRFTPSLVTTSDAGNGVGYTGLRIRGSDATRVNVTINGIPLNDSESQGVFWVNTPDLASSADAIQIQRGVGTSTNGAGAFGGTVKVNTLGKSRTPSATISNAIGSFNTFKHTVQASTGLFNNFSLEARLSQITSDGFIDRATSDLKSYYMAGTWDNGNTKIAGVVFGGRERTYQSWWGTPQSRIENDREGMLAHAANNGLSASQTENLLNSGRTYNYYEYENEVDNYNQDHYQLHFTQRLGSYLRLDVSGHYTYGRGFFEQFRSGDDFSDYGLSPIVFDAQTIWSDGTDGEGNPINYEYIGYYEGNGQVEISQSVVTDEDDNPILDGEGNTLLEVSAQISETDVIRRRWLENDFYGAVWGLTYNRNRLNTVLGGGWNRYDGDHFGELTWMEHPNGTSKDDIYYLGNGLKTDFNIYLKSIYRITDVLSAYVDLQQRTVDYVTSGTDNDLRAYDIEDNLSFFNPKAGLTWYMSRQDKVYGSYAVANREPVRGDYIDAPSGQMPKPENLQDIEIGYQRNADKYYFGANLYYMKYKDQLVLTGALNDVGGAIRENVDESFRQGIELELSWNVLKRLNWWATATFSQNYITEHTEFIADYTNGFEIVEIQHNNTQIAFSPNVTAASVLTFLALSNTNHEVEVAWQTKYVGEQYLNNTEDPNRTIDAFLVNDLRATYRLKNRVFKQLELNAWVHNMLDLDYSNNGYTYDYIFGDRIVENFYYPQAGRNYTVGLTIGF